MGTCICQVVSQDNPCVNRGADQGIFYKSLLLTDEKSCEMSPKSASVDYTEGLEADWSNSLQILYRLNPFCF